MQAFKTLVGNARKLPLVKNMLVLLMDRGAQLLIQLFNIFFLTRYLGPEQFGILMYALALYGLVVVITNLGLERVLVIEFSKPNASTEEIRNILGSGTVIKLAASLVVYLLLFFCQGLFKTFISGEVYTVFLVLAANVFFSSWIIIDAFNQSIGAFRSTAYSRIIAALLIIGSRAAMIVYHLPLKWIVFSFIIEQIICLLICIFISKQFLRVFRDLIRHGARFTFNKRLFSSGLSVVLSTVCIILYFRTSQGIVEQKFDKVFLGIYSLVISLVEIPVSLSSIMATVFTPALARDMAQQPLSSQSVASKLFWIFFLVGTMSALILVLVGYVLSIFLGAAYAGFFGLLVKGVFALPLIFTGYYFNTFLMCSKQYRKYLVVTFIAAGCTFAALFVLKDHVTTATAIYLYLTAHLIASVLVPVIVVRQIREVISLAVAGIRTHGFIHQLKALTRIDFNYSNGKEQ